MKTDLPLALRYRPQTFTDMVGQRPVQVVLHYMIHERVAGGQNRPREVPTVPPGLLFYGQRGTGKTSAARVVAASLNCQAPGRRPCTACVSCQAVQDGTSLAVAELDAASNGLVSDIRKLTDAVSYDLGVPYRVVILDEAHAMSGAGFNALLKTLEEPPPRTVFVLITTEYSKILPTVASRCSPFEFRRITPAAITSRLGYIAQDWAGVPVDTELLAELADRADGAMRDAVVLLEQCIQSGIYTLEAFRKLHGDRDLAPELLTACALGNHAELFARSERALGSVGDPGVLTGQLVRCLRDVLVLHAGGVLMAQAATLERRQSLARIITPPAALGALRVLWSLQTSGRPSDPKAAMDLALVMCSEAMRKVLGTVSYQRAVPTPGHGAGHMTNDRVRQLVASHRG